MTVNLYGGIPHPGMKDFFTYSDVMYLLTLSNGTYIAVHTAFTAFMVYASEPEPRLSQRQLAVLNLRGTTYMVTTLCISFFGGSRSFFPGTN